MWWWWQWWDYGVSVCSFSTVSPHGLLPPLSFYSLLLGDASLSPIVTQAKTPLSSFARACYLGNTAIPPLLFYTHLLSSLILPTSNPPLFSLGWTQTLFLEHGHADNTWVIALHLKLKYDKFSHVCSWIDTVTFQPRSFHHFNFAVERCLHYHHIILRDNAFLLKHDCDFERDKRFWF